MTDLDRISRWRSFTSKAAALFCLLFLLTTLDALIAQFRDVPNELHMIAGDSVKVNGQLRESVPGTEALTCTSTSDLIGIQFAVIHQGFWLGGTMWRGALTVAAGISPGSYSVTVTSTVDPPNKPSAVFRVVVYPDRESLIGGSRSIFKRHTGISPWWGFALFLPLSIATVAAVYLLSQKRDQMLASEGKAEVYHITAMADGYQIVFGLGARHGLSPGSHLTLLDKSGSPAGTVEVTEATDTDATGMLPPECTVKIGYLVRQ